MRGLRRRGDLGGFEGPQGDALHQRAWVADFDAVREDGDADFVGVSVVAVAEGVDDGFAQGLAVDLRHIHADETVESHADADVFEDVFFRFFDQGEDVAVEIVLVNDGRGGGCGKNGAAEREGGGLAKKTRAALSDARPHGGRGFRGRFARWSTGDRLCGRGADLCRIGLEAGSRLGSESQPDGCGFCAG